MTRDAATHDAVLNPRAGDRYHEMCSFWIYVLRVTPHEVTTMDAHPPCRLPRDGVVVTQTREEFRRRLEYDTMPGQYWLRLADRGNDVSGWLPQAMHLHPEDFVGKVCSG